MLIIALNLLNSDPPRAFAYASEIPSRLARDSVFAVAASRTFFVNPDSSIALARQIGTRSLRGATLLDLAGRVAARGDTARARSLVREGIPGIDPLTHPPQGVQLVGLVRGGLYDVALQWARRQTTPESRARVFFALYEAVAAQ